MTKAWNVVIHNFRIGAYSVLNKVGLSAAKKMGGWISESE